MSRKTYNLLQETVQTLLIMLHFVFNLLMLACISTGYQIPTIVCVFCVLLNGWFTAKVIYTMERGK